MLPMRAILHRMPFARWIYLTLLYGCGEMYLVWEHGRLTLGKVTFCIAFGLLAAFSFAWLAPWMNRCNARIERLFSRR